MRKLVLALVTAALCLPATAQAAESWNPTVGGGASGSSGQIGCRSSSCGSVNGQIIWFDVENLDNDRISWPKPFLNAQRDAIVARRKSPTQVSTELSRNPDNPNLPFRSLLWSNVCFDRGAGDVDQFLYDPPGAGSKITGCRSSSSYTAGTRESFGRWNELHTANPDGTGSAPVLGQIVGWNIRVWREGRATPVFERRIGLWTNGAGDDDPLGLGGDRNRKWWYGGNTESANADCPSSTRSNYWSVPGGGRLSGCKRAAGPLGSMDEDDQYRCRAHLGSSQTNRVFTAQEDVYGRGGYRYTNAAYTDPDRLGRTSCYWNIGDTKNSGEAIRVTWSSIGGKVSISYKLQGRPGFFYAVHITAIDAREQLMSQRRTTSNATFLHGVNDSNYFRIFMPGGRTFRSDCTENCEPTGEPPNEPPTTTPPNEPESPNQSEPPEPLVNLTASAAIPTRVFEDAQVTVAADSLDERQALFPTITRLLHFTPQMRYNGGRAASSYTRDYVAYDSDTGQRLPPPREMGATPVPLKVALLEQPAYLGAEVDPTQLSINHFGIAWLRPTIENPCNVEIQARNLGTVSQLGAWPVDGSSCYYPAGAVARNVWDDYLEASVIYEARWLANGSRDNPVGWVNNQPLRCYGQPGAGAVSVENCEAAHRLQSYNGSAFDNAGDPVGSTQRVQGYARVVPRSGNSGALGVRLQTNRPDLVTGARLWERASRQEVDEAGQPFLRRPPVRTTADQWLWFCSNGIPAQARLDIGTASAADDRTASEISGGAGPWRGKVIMDAKGYAEACAGYTAKWQWAQPSTDWSQPWGSCAYNTPARRASSFPRPSDDSFVTQASAWGRYGEDETWAFAEYDLRPLLNGTVPYEGSRPGRPSLDAGTAAQGCEKQFVGRYYDGRWVKDRVEQRQTGTRRVQIGTTPRTCVLWNRPRPPRTCIESEGGDPIYETRSIYRTFNVFQWRWDTSAGNCLPTAPNPDRRPNLRVISSATQTEYVRTPMPAAPAGEYRIEDGDYNPFSEANWYCGRTVGAGNSFVTTGEWVQAYAAGPGWGKQQNGPRLPDGEYAVEWTFANLNPSMAADVQWSLYGTYAGHTRWQWMSQTLNSGDSEAARVGQTVAVFGTRLTR